MAGGGPRPDGGQPPVLEYDPGTWGPPASKEIVNGDDTWHDPVAEKILAMLSAGRGDFSAGCGQHPAGQRSLCRGSRRPSGSRPSAPPNARATGRSSADCASSSGLPTTWGACRRFAPGSTTIRICWPCRSFCWNIRSAARLFPRALEDDGSLGYARPPRGAVGRRHRVSAAQNSALGNMGCGRRPGHDLPAQGTRTRPYAAALSGQALCHGGRQAELVGGHEIES